MMVKTVISVSLDKQYVLNDEDGVGGRGLFILLKIEELFLLQLVEFQLTYKIHWIGNFFFIPLDK